MEKTQVTCSIIVPTYNEEKRIRQCLTTLLSTLPEDYEIIVAVDGCTDKTIEIAKDFPVKIATHPKRLGKGGGILNAMKHTEGDTVMLCDVDLSVSPTAIPRIVSKLGSSDLVICFRQMINYPLHRRILSLGFNLLFRLLFRIPIRDTQSGFKAVKKQVMQKIGQTLKTKGFTFDVELIVKTHKMGYQITEVPVTWHYQKGSKVNVLQQCFLWHGI